MSFVFYKVPFEGQVGKVYELIKSRDWDVSLKMPENGILFLKISEESEGEVLFYQNIVFNENTKSKFGIFESISESIYETAESIEIPNSEENTANKDKNEDKEKNKNIVNFEKKMEAENLSLKLNKRQNSFLGRQLSNISSYITSPLTTKASSEKLKTYISKEYKDPYDFFFSQNYLIAFLIFAFICLIIFGF